MPKIVNKNEEKSRMVNQLSGLGIPHEQICSILKISRPTLYKYYENELKQGKAQANAKVAQNLFNIATGTGRGAVTAGIFWLKTQAGWKETTTLEVIDGAEQEQSFKELIDNLRGIKLTKEDSDNTTH